MTDMGQATPDMAVAAHIVQAHHAALRNPSPVLASKFGASDFAALDLFDPPTGAFDTVVSESIFDAPNEPGDVMMMDSGGNVEAGVVTSAPEPEPEPEPAKAVPDQVVEIDGFALEEFSTAPPPLPRRSVGLSSSPQLWSLHGADLPATKARPPMIQCDRCLKWRLIEDPIPTLPPQWTCPNDGCAEDEDYWASKSHRLVPYRKLSLPTAEQAQQQAEELKKIQELLPRLPAQLRSYSCPEANDEPQSASVESVFWTVPKAFVETDERKKWYQSLQTKLLQKGQLTRSYPKIGPLKQPVDLYALFHAVQELSTHATSMNDIWVQAAAQLDLEVTPTALRACYMRFLQLLTPIRSIAMRSEGSITPAKRGRPSLIQLPILASSTSQAEIAQLFEMVTALTERVSSLEKTVTKLADAQQAASLEALQSINSRVVELSENVHESNAIMQELLPEFKEPPRDP